jgi:hypothetical protein|tara:strand:- start:197 stop:358 length:162 start_codon:yes stop_codon:yes gene_type:complete
MKLLLATLIGFIGLLVFIQFLHVKAHRDMEIDVHGHCMKNKEGVRRVLEESGY